MSHPGDWMCQCQVEALYKKFDKEIASLKGETIVPAHARRGGAVLPVIKRTLEAG